MPKCAFTGEELPFGTGKMYIKKDGKVLFFSSRTAEKNVLKLKRNPRNVKHTAAARVAKEQHMAEMQHEKEEQKEEKKPVKKPAKKTPAKKAPAKKKAPTKEAKK
ncbi:MAG: 50S ribosomal protein L24e [Candidatus Woesearchaeota archaeon]|nr:50S ribosomal protein L24e [Candidatus Woesearchaeota archaeon]